MFGYRMARPTPGTAAAALEDAVLANAGLELAAFGAVQLEGGRRVGRLRLESTGMTIAVEEQEGHEHHERALRFRFCLPPGAYATCLLREFMKCE